PPGPGRAPSSRSESVQVSRERSHLADVGRLHEACDPALQTDRETTVRRHAVPEGREVRVVRRRVLAACPDRRDVVAVPVQTLSTGDELEATEEQVEAVAPARAAGL